MTRTRTATTLCSLAVASGIAVLSAPAAHASTEPTSASAVQVAGARDSGQLVADWNRQLLAIEQTPGAQPAAVHPTRSFAILQAAIYDAVVSTTHHGAPYAFEVVTQAGARPDAAADQAAHDVLSTLFPSLCDGARHAAEHRARRHTERRGSR